jgi:hypothetical protein
MKWSTLACYNLHHYQLFSELPATQGAWVLLYSVSMYVGRLWFIGQVPDVHAKNPPEIWSLSKEWAIV